MEHRKIRWREPAQAFPADQLLASRYSQLLEWGAVLTRGDAAKAEEIVQECCLYFTLTKPDLSGVDNLDGYLYTCLRHIYLSGLARSSREALYFVSIAEFDSFASALAANRSGDPLQKQNDLRRICGYEVWRKESSKSASYFILHFFHGYGRREIAGLALLPISAIYNKLKIARAEVKAYLEEPGKLRIVNRGLPPEPALSWTVVSSGELFRELRETILRARISDCLSEEELLACYRSSMHRPISCSLLAHLVSCERCLAVVDRHFRRPTLKDREPLDGFGSSSDNGSVAGASGMGYKALSQSVRKRWGEAHEHRPRTLSIAVNGQIIAFHEVQAPHSTLSARIEHPEKAQFVEVFSEQDVRLALLPIGELPPGGPHGRTQRVALSDARWLELNLTFDGLGLNSEVAYFDPALAIEAIEAAEEDPEESPVALESKPNTPIPASGLPLRLRAAYAACTRVLRALAPSSAIAWALTLAIVFGAASYWTYRHRSAPIHAQEILNESIKIETANLRGQTEHQVLRIEEVTADGQVLQQGVVDLWRDGDGRRYVRRLYDSQHRMIAAEWRNKNGEHSLRRKERGKGASGEHRPLLANEFWDQDLSAHAFSMLGGKAPQVRAVEDGYELTTVGPVAGHPSLISATLVLNRRLLPVREIMRVRAAGLIREIRLVQEDYERKPSASVPDTVFDPGNEQLRSENQGPAYRHSLPSAMSKDVQLAELQIAVLYRLNALGADTGEPIEVVRTPDGRVRVSGSVADDALQQKIVSQLQTLAGHQFLEINLLSPRDGKARVPGIQQAFPEDTSVYDVNQTKSAADATLRKHFAAKGLSGKGLDSAMERFSQDALEHAQRALQHAYALDRLGSALSAAELTSMSLSSQQQWTEMADKHASALEGELRALRGQLAEIVPSSAESPDTGGELLRIENPAEFNRAADQLLRQTQDLNRDAGSAFTSNASGERQLAQSPLLVTMMNAIPLRQAEEIASFAVRLNASANPALVNRQNSGDGTKIPGQPR